MRSEQDELTGSVRSVTTGGRCCSWAVQSEAVQSSQSQRDTDLIHTASSVLVGVAAVCVWTAAQLKKVKKKKRKRKEKKKRGNEVSASQHALRRSVKPGWTLRSERHSEREQSSRFISIHQCVFVYINSLLFVWFSGVNRTPGLRCTSPREGPASASPADQIPLDSLQIV